jgi:hypothetical protein
MVLYGIKEFCCRSQNVLVFAVISRIWRLRICGEVWTLTNEMGIMTEKIFLICWTVPDGSGRRQLDNYTQRDGKHYMEKSFERIMIAKVTQIIYKLCACGRA